MQNPSTTAGIVPGPWGVRSLAHELSNFANTSHRGRGDEAASAATVVGGEVRPDGTFDLNDRERQDVTALARTMSRYTARTGHEEDPLNPFVDNSDPTLDPASDSFEPRRWMRQLLSLPTRGSGGAQTRTAGVSLKNLNVYGFGSETDYQADVGNIWFKALEGLRTWLGLRHKRRIDILRNFDGLVRSGEMLVVLGRPGSGCSTLLKTIAGETYGLNVNDPEHSLQYQGIPFGTMHSHFRGETIYQAEVDVHFPQLTVGQTLAFAAKARAPRNRPEGVTRDQWALHVRDAVMAIFGLTDTVDVKVGNEYIRGVSGGQRKRVSIAEVALSRSPLQCWDNSTRGLDAATALEFIKTLRLSTELTGSTALVAIYQAPQSAYDIFDKVILLYEGQQIYFGNTKSARKFFEDMGFECPDRQTTPDFLTSLSSPSERVVKKGWEERVPRTADDFATRWRDSVERKTLLQEIDAYEREFPIGGSQMEKFKQSRMAEQAKHTRWKSPYTISVPMQVRLCISRGFQRTKGDLENTLTTIIGNISLALIISSVFYNLSVDTSSFYLRGALLFFAILMNALSSALEILTLYQQRPIVEKHAKYALYHPFAEAIASTICEFPSKIIVAVGFNLVIYFMTNLRREVDAFFIFFLFSFVCTLSMSFIFRTIGALSKTLSQAMAPAAIFILALIIYTGFTLPIRDMHPWFRWINYIDPIGYAFEALMINEFSHRKWPCSQYIPSGPGYENVNAFSKACNGRGSVPGQNYIDGDAYLNTSFQYYRSHLWRNLGIMIAFTLFFAVTYLVATELISSTPSKGEVLVFRRNNLPVKKRPDDEEASAAGSAAAAVSNRGDNGKTVAIQRQTDIFQWKDVCYDIPVKGGTRRLLDHVDGWVKPGTLTALMGVSGAGKTTLLDVLASRVTMGVITGDMLVNGHQRDRSFQRKTGYVQQQDLHLPTSTVREALRFSALLRQPRTTPKHEKLAYVEEVIKLLEMENYAEAVVGILGEGLNVEQRKRLTIGVELAAKPQLLIFFDEPTSGLDSQTAWSICVLMRKLANNGQAVLSTIHQPSAILLQEFDRLLFLASGGKTVYFGEMGPNASTLIQYFERNGAHPCPHDANPAEWMLEVIGAAPGSHSERDWPEVWKGSQERVSVRDELDTMRTELSQKQHSADDNTSLDEFAMPFGSQLSNVLRRVFQQYWRTPSYIYSKITLGLSTSAFIGFSFWMAGTSLQALQNEMLATFMLLTIFGNLAQQIMPHFVMQRALYEVRERPSKTYSWQSFMVANILVELPWQSLLAVLTFVTWYYPMGMYKNAQYTDTLNERAGLMFLLIWIFYMHTSTFTAMVIAGVETAELGGNIANLMFSLCLIFCGVLATPDSLPRFWIFMNRVSPYTYLVSAMLTTGLAHAPVICSDIEFISFEPPSGQTCAAYMANYIATAGGKLSNPNATSGCRLCPVTSTDTFLGSIQLHYDDRWRNFGLMVVYTVFNIFAALFLYWLARVPKGKKSKEMKAEEALIRQKTRQSIKEDALRRQMSRRSGNPEAHYSMQSLATAAHDSTDVKEEHRA